MDVQHTKHVTDKLAYHCVFDILGFFLGYMSDPILAESTEEHQERMKHVVILPEEACPTRRAL